MQNICSQSSQTTHGTLVIILLGIGLFAFVLALFDCLYRILGIHDIVRRMNHPLQCSCHFTALNLGCLWLLVGRRAFAYVQSVMVVPVARRVSLALVLWMVVQWVFLSHAVGTHEVAMKSDASQNVEVVVGVQE